MVTYSKEFTYIEAAAGTGMLSVAVEIAIESIGFRAIPACYIEREACAAASIVARLENTAMGCPHIWDDVRTFNGKRWAGCVDWFIAGYPCQPFSAAGKRLGTRDTRHIWPELRRIIKEAKPGFCFFENVPGHLTKGLGIVVRDLEEMGYRVTPGLFTSAEMGASIYNQRLFILATPHSSQRDPGCATSTTPVPGSSIRNTGDTNGGMAAPECERRKGKICGISKDVLSSECNRYMAASSGTGLQERSGESGDSRPEFTPTERGCGVLGQTTCSEQQRNSVSGTYRERRADRGSIREFPYYPPPRDIDLVFFAKALQKSTSDAETQEIISDAGDLAKAIFCSWAAIARMDASRMPAIESPLRGMDAGLVSIADRVRLAGNGVDVLQAAYALITLLACCDDYGERIMSETLVDRVTKALALDVHKTQEIALQIMGYELSIDSRVDEFIKYCGAWMDKNDIDCSCVKWNKYNNALRLIYNHLPYQHDFDVWLHITPVKYRLAAFIAAFGDRSEL